MSTVRRTLFSILLTVLVTVLIAGLGSGLAQTVTVGLFQDPPHLDPALATATSEYNVIHQIFDTLLSFDADGELAPALAESWSVSDDGLTYSFTLRDGVTFHDGTVMDAEAVRYSLERARSFPSGAFVEPLGVIESIEVTGPASLEITLSQPQGSFLTLMADVASMVVSPTAAEAGAGQFDLNPVGTGPFSFVERVQQDSITLASFADYWGGAPAVSDVVFKPFPDGAIRYANLLSGAVDIIYPIEPKDYITARDEAGLALLNQPTNGWRIIVFNTRRPPFDDIDVRRAVAAAIDTQAVSQVVFNSLEAATGGPLPEVSPFYSAANEARPVDLEAATSLLDGVGGVEFALTTIARSPENQLTQLIQAMASQAGADLEIQPVEVGEYLRRAENSDFDALTMQWSGTPDPDGNITSFFITDGFWNWSGYSNPEVDALLSEAQTTTDAARRTELYADAIALVNEDVPVIWLTNQQRLVATTAAIDGVELSVNTGIMQLEGVTKAE